MASEIPLSYGPAPGIWVGIILSICELFDCRSLAQSETTKSRQITIIYLDTSDAIRQAVLSGRNWEDIPTLPRLFHSAKVTKLSASIILGPLLEAGNATNDIHFASTAFYQSTNGSITMMNLDPSAANTSGYSSSLRSPVDTNIISPFFNSSSDKANILGSSLSCIHNGQTTNFSSHFFTACYFKESIYVWEYNRSDVHQNESIDRFNGSMILILFSICWCSYKTNHL